MSVRRPRLRRPVVPLYGVVALVAGGGSAGVCWAALTGVPSRSGAVGAAMAQFAVDTMIAFGDGERDLLPRAQWWQRVLFTVGAVAQVAGGITSFLVPAAADGQTVFLLGVVGCVTALAALVPSIRTTDCSWFIRCFATGAGLGYLAYVAALVGVAGPWPLVLLLAASSCEVAAAVSTVRFVPARAR